MAEPGSLRARNVLVLELRAQGLSQSKIGARVGVSPQRVAQILVELGVPRSKWVHPRSIEAIVRRDFDEIERWVDGGGTLCALAKKYAVDYDSFCNHCHRLGIYSYLAATEVDQLLWVDLYVNHRLSTHAIAKRTGHRQSTIHVWLRRRGVIRTRLAGLRIARAKQENSP